MIRTFHSVEESDADIDLKLCADAVGQGVIPSQYRFLNIEGEIHRGEIHRVWTGGGASVGTFALTMPENKI